MTHKWIAPGLLLACLLSIAMYPSAESPRSAASSGTTSAAPAATTTAPWSETVLYEFEYRVDLKTSGPGAVSIWIPYPPDTRAQRVLKVEPRIPMSWRLGQERKFGNKIAYLQGTGPLQETIVFTYVVERKPFLGIPPAAAAPGTPLDPDRYLGPDKLIPLESTFQKLAAEQAPRSAAPSRKARAFYDYIYKTMTYKKEGTGWGRGDAIWACNAKYGNCTDFHSLFIGMARSAGIPARFVIGFPIPQDRREGPVAGYHCWAEYYDPDRGWLGLDASEAWKSKNPNAYFGVLPNDRIEFTVGRDLILEPPQRGESLNYFIYPYAEANGKPVADLKTDFRFRRLPTPQPGS